MRQEVIDYLQGLNLGTFTVSTELPWTDNTIPLYVKNLKKIYVGVDEFTVNPIIITLNGLNITEDVNTVRIYFANDAKQIPPNYEDVVSQMRTVKNINTTTGFNRRECDVITTFDSDKLITELEIRFIKIT
jgi:hypothetical protein